MNLHIPYNNKSQQYKLHNKKRKKNTYTLRELRNTFLNVFHTRTNNHTIEKNYSIHQPGTSGWIAEYHDNLGDENGLCKAKGNDDGVTVGYGGRIVFIDDGGVGEPNDRLFGVGDGGPKVRLCGPGEGTPKLISESESSLWAGLCDVSLHLLGLDNLLLPPCGWCRECASWAANCCCCNLKQKISYVNIQ